MTEEEVITNLQRTGDLLKDGEDLVFNPYNPNNVEITEDEVLDILKRYGLPCKIRNFNLYRRAFIHRSYTKRPELENKTLNITLASRPIDCLPLSTKSNERLEFLGDGVLELVVKHYLYRRFPKEDEGFMTEKKIALVKNEHIGKLALALGLQKWFIISRHAEEKFTRTNLKKLGCLFEAFIGAIFLDQSQYVPTAEELADEEYEDEDNVPGAFSFRLAQRFVESVLEQEVDWTHLISVDDNFKNQLQVKIQKTFKTTPHYIQDVTFDSTDMNGEIKMVVCLCLNQQIYQTSLAEAIDFPEFGSFEAIMNFACTEDNCKPVLVKLGEGIHKTKKKAEQLACAQALKVIGPNDKA
jgi:dsRNA-specific ribonuclease